MQFRAIVIDPVGNSRIFAVQAIRVLQEFQDVVSIPSISEALDYCKNKGLVDLCFLSYRLKPEDCRAFIAEAKTIFAKSGCAIISVMNAQDASDQAMGSALSKGTDGVLCEPYSVEDLRHCVKVAAKMKLSGTKDRAKAGISFILMAMINRVQAADEKAQPIDEKDKGWQEMTQICKDLKSLAVMAGEDYDAMINDIFSDLDKSKDLKNTVSRRLKEKFDLEEKTRSVVRSKLLGLT